jgi:Tfp pilus assembly protein PilO
MSELRALIEGLLKRRKAFLWLLVVLLVNGAVFAGVTHRLANKQERLTAELERLRAELGEKKEELRILSESEALAARNAEAVRRFWSDVVQERAPGLTEAWEEIDRLASETNVVRGRTGYDRDLLDVGLEQIRATMPVEGDYFDLVRFINRLERSERFFLVEQITISQRTTDDARIQLECAIAFFLKAGAGIEGAGP